MKPGAVQRIWAIHQRELHSLFVTPTAYLIITSFIFMSAYFFFNLLGSFNVLMSRYASQPYGSTGEIPNLNQWIVEPFFQSLVGLFIFVVPILTMRSIAEERQKGTAEMLLTSCSSCIEIVLGKFLALSLFLTILSVSAGVFPCLLGVFGEPEWPPIIVGIFGVTLYAIALGSVGVAVSAFCKSQVLAGGLTAILLVLLFVIHSPAEMVGGSLAEFLYYISPAFQVRELIRGVVAAHVVVYFASVCILALFVAQSALKNEQGR